MLLIDSFITKMQDTMNTLLKRLGDDVFLRTGAGAMVQAAKLSDGFVFTESSMAMLSYHAEHLEETIARFHTTSDQTAVSILERISYDRGVWLEYPKPVDAIRGWLFFVPSRYLRTGKDTPQLLLFGEGGDVIDTLEWVGRDLQYNSLWHRCPQCWEEQNMLTPCAYHKTLALKAGLLLSLSALIASQALAEQKYEEKTVTSRIREKREKSNKTRSVPLKHYYRVIDASELVIPVLSEEEPQRAKEQRGSWRYDPDVVMETITTRAFTRTYKHPRYVNVRGTTVEFPEGVTRQQPRKIGRLGKGVTKVKASHYEEGESV